ncbi:[FeFe] hydrogenase, group A [Mycoplasmatota bacterium WC44]
MSKMIKININNQELEVNQGTTVLQAAQDAGINIPTLCFLKEINEIAACRMCVAEFDRMGLKPTCTLEAQEGMKVQTESQKVVDSRIKTLELLASNHVFECWTCPREESCYFYDMLQFYNVEDTYRDIHKLQPKERIINQSKSITLDSGKCVHCSSCVAVCEKIQTPGTLDFNNRGFETLIAPTNTGETLDDIACISCGQCSKVCPTAAIYETDHIKQVEAAIKDPNKYVVVQIAPATRTAIGEPFGYPIGTPVREVEGKMYHALKLLGFDMVTDTNYAADLTIMEEGTEFINRVTKHLNGEEVSLPMFTSCSPGWVRYIEQYRPEYLQNLSTAKSPHMMQGAFIKNLFAPDQLKKDASEIYMVSIMPCTAKKFEIDRPEMEVDGVRDVDAVLTTRELARMIKGNNINFRHLEDYAPNNEFAKYTGAATIFGATGGVMEAAVRTVYKVLEGKELDNIDLTQVRGMHCDNQIKEATIKVAGIDVNVAVVHGGSGIKKMFEILDEGKKQYHFIEFMGCPGGCVNGGGQPIVREEFMHGLDVAKLRAQALYDSDAQDTEFRRSHNSPAIKWSYETYLEKPGSHLAHKLLHTTYTDQSHKLKK